jgi:hypothetical protein
LNEVREGESLMLSGIEFQTAGEATLKARAPKAVDTDGE